MNKKLIWILISSAIVIACSKEKTNLAPRMDLQTRSDWVIQKAEEKTGNNPRADAFPFWQPSEKDDRWKFKTDFSLEMNESAIPCGTNSSHQIIDIVTRAFENNETKLLIDGMLADIEVLNETSLIISAVETGGGITYYSKLSFGH